MQCDGTVRERKGEGEKGGGGGGVQNGEQTEFAYLSSTPSTPAIRPGPIMAIHCNIANTPRSQGIRMSISARFETADQVRKASRGILGACRSASKGLVR